MTESNRVVEDIKSKMNGDSVAVAYEDYLKGIADKILSEAIPPNWEGYAQLGLIDSEKELTYIKKFEKIPRESRSKEFNKEPDVYADILLELLIKLNKEETLQYLLTLIDQLFKENPEAVEAFIRLSHKTEKNRSIFEPFLRILSKQSGTELYTKAKSSHLAAELMSKADNVPKEAFKQMATWIREQLKKPEDRDVYGALLTLRKLLRTITFRHIFAEEEGLELLGGVFKAKLKVPQLAYQSAACLWLMSYEADIATKMNDSKLIPIYVDNLKNPAQEKLLRMSLATLRNLLGFGTNNTAMLEVGIQKSLDVLSSKNWKDDDIIEDLQVLKETLAANIAELTTYDFYKQEILTGELEWSSPAHRSEKFWKENCHRLEEEDCKLLKTLKGLLGAKNANVVSIACHDLGEFARFHPRGKQIVHQMGIKLELMTLMESKEPEVRKHSLLAVQKLMVSNWAAASFF